MKKIYLLLSLIALFLTETSFSQVDPPSNVQIILNFESDGYAVMQWDVDTTGMIDHYEVFLDEDELFCSSISIGYLYFNECIPGIFEEGVYHDAGVRAVTNTGAVSDMVTFNFFYYTTAYTHPTNLHVANDLNAGTTMFTWDEPLYGAGEEQPTVIDYSVYLNGDLVSNTTDTQFEFFELSQGNSYVAGIMAHYSDGYSDTTFFPRNAMVEFYFDELSAPVNLSINESSGLLSWGKPNCDGDVIGGTFTNYPVAMWWYMGWYTGDQYTTFGNSEQFVNTMWVTGSWVHGTAHVPDEESIWFNLAEIDAFSYAYADVQNISEITATGDLSFTDQLKAHDVTFNPDGIGDFIAHYNYEEECYGVIRVDDFHDYFLYPYEGGSIDMTWWLQTNGSDDFSTAYNYYPNYYLIYLDDEFVDTVQPGYEQQYDFMYEYQFEGLAEGQTYTAGIEAVYHVGKSKMETVEFITVGINENQENALLQAVVFPNPVSSNASISYSISEAGPVTIEIYNLKGEKVRTLVDKKMATGEHQTIWNRNDDKGNPVADGIYFCILSSGNNSTALKLLVE